MTAWGAAPWGAFSWGDVDTLSRDALSTAPVSVLSYMLRHGAPLARVTLLRQGVDQVELPVTGGSVQCRDGEGVHRQLSGCTVLTSDLGWRAPEALSRLSPFQGAEVRVELGCAEPRSGAMAWWPVMVGPVTRVQASSPGSVTIDAADRMWWLAGHPLLTPLALNAAAPVEETIRQIVAPGLPSWVRYVPSATGLESPVMFIGAGESRITKSLEQAKAAGHRLAFDADGVLRLRRLYELAATTPAAEWTSDDGNLFAFSTEADYAEGADGYLVQWGSSWLAGPDASRRRYARYEGDSTLLRTEAHARRAGEGLLATRGRGQQSFSYEAPANPLVGEADVLLARDDTLGVAVAARNRGMTYTLGSGVMSGQLAERVIA